MTTDIDQLQQSQSEATAAQVVVDGVTPTLIAESSTSTPSTQLDNIPTEPLGTRETTESMEQSEVAQIPPTLDPSPETPSTTPPSTEPSIKGKERASLDDREEDTASKESIFNCSICLDTPEDPVVTPCGHLTCWSCMHEWLVTSRARVCPVCKSPCSVDRLIPIYSANSTNPKDPRTKPLPPRPRPTAPPPSSTTTSSSSFGSTFVPNLFGFAGLPNYTIASSSSFSFQAGVFPLPGLSLSWSNQPRTNLIESMEDNARNYNAHDQDERRARGGGSSPLSVEQEQARQWFQQVFLVLFFALFVMMTFSGGG